MNVAPVVDRLRDRCPALKLVGGAAQFERAAQALAALPAAFVIVAKETARPNEHMAQIVQQQVAATFAVLIATRNLADGEGAAALETLEPVRESIRAALLAWPPFADADGCEYQMGELQLFANGTLWWADYYTTSYLVRSA